MPGLLCCDFRNDSAGDGLASLLLPEEEEDEDEAKRELKLPPLPTWLLRNGCCVGSTEGAKSEAREEEQPPLSARRAVRRRPATPSGRTRR